MTVVALGLTVDQSAFEPTKCEEVLKKSEKSTCVYDKVVLQYVLDERSAPIAP